MVFSLSARAYPNYPINFRGVQSIVGAALVFAQSEYFSAIKPENNREPKNNIGGIKR